MSVCTLRDIHAGGHKAFSAPCLNDVQVKKLDSDVEKAGPGSSNSDVDGHADGELSRRLDIGNGMSQQV